jgi:hypothetical protein
MRVLCLVCCAALLPVPTAADHIGVYGDPAGLSCTISPPLAGPFDVYVVYHATGPRSGFAFRAWLWLEPGVSPDGWDPGPGFETRDGSGPSGDPYGPGVVSPGGGDVCWTGGRLLLVLHFTTTGPVAGEVCNRVGIRRHADPRYPGYSWECSFSGPAPMAGASTDMLSFGFAPGACQDCALAVESSTWGSLKALYR